MNHNPGLLAALCCAGAFAGSAAVVVENQRCEYQAEPIGIDATAPRLTWTVADAGTLPENSIVKVALSESDLKGGKMVWRSPLLGGDKRRAEIDAPGVLTPHTRYVWRVEGSDVNGEPFVSPVACFETGKLGVADWRGVWISDGKDKEFEPAPMFRKEFDLKKVPAAARAYVTAAGYYELWINGQRVGDSHMEPGYTHYDKRNLYVTHDVTPLLRKGKNVVSAVLGNGFYNCQSKAVWDFETARWRNRPAMLLEITGRDKNGRETLLTATDGSWKVWEGPYTYNNIYSGDRYDARKEPRGWKDAGFDDSAWEQAVAVDAPSPIVKAQGMPSIRPVEKITPRLIGAWGDTVFVFDMGKNIAGVPSLSVKGEEGTRLVVSSGELLGVDGRLLQDNINVYYRPQKPGEKFQTDEFILAGTGSRENFTPGFTYHGFRYVEVVSDTPLKLGEDNVTGLFMHTDVKPAGSFSCSDTLLNRIYDATMLSYLGNLHGIPTDCPQREKNGWTADAHVAVDLALLNFDGITLYEKWMNDFADNQRESGNIAGIIPSAGWGYGDWPGPVWDAALFIIPDALYRYYGDARAIETLYPTMERYFDWIGSKEDESGLVSNGLGDWLTWGAQTPSDFTASVYYYLDCMYMADFARILGKDAAPYAAKADALKRQINARYFNAADNTYANGTQAAMGVALYAGIVPQEKEQAVAARLRDIVAANNHFLDFGLLGSKTVLRMLTKYGYVDDAYQMATKTEAPSWGYWIEKCGYTTLPETWTLSPEFRDASLNHVFMGDIAAWMTNSLAGINYDSDAPGFAHVRFTPHFPRGLEHASATYRSVMGEVASEWVRKGNKVTLTVKVPAGATATVFADEPKEVGSGTHTFEFSL